MFTKDHVTSRDFLRYNQTSHDL